MPTAATETAFVVEWPCPWPENAPGFPDNAGERACLAVKRDPNAAPTTRMILPAAAPTETAGISVDEIGVMELAI